MAEKRAVILDEPRLKSAEYERSWWIVNAAEGTQVSDVLEPVYWSFIADRLRPYDRIEVRVDTGEWLLDLLVLGCDRAWARVAVLHKYDLGPVEAEMPAAQKHRIEWKGPQLKWCVIRNADSEIIAKGHDKTQAFAELERYERMPV